MNPHLKGEQSILLSEFPEFAARRLEFHDKEIVMLLGKVQALNLAVLHLAANAQAPARLLKNWHATVAEAVDQEMQHSFYELAEFREAYQSQLAEMTRLLEGIVKSRSR